MAYCQVQTLFDAAFVRGQRYYFKCKYSVNPHPTSETKAFSSQSWYKGGHGKYPATRHSPLGACTGQGEGCDTLCPTDRGADETGLYRAHLAGALLAGAGRAAGGGGNPPESKKRTPTGHPPRAHPPPRKRGKPEKN